MARGAAVRVGSSVGGVLAVSLAIALMAFGPVSASAGGGGASGPRVLEVAKSGHGFFHSIQAAVDAAHPGDWILVAPGDYHERSDYSGPYSAAGGDAAGAGVWIPPSKHDIHIRGLNRNGVIVDGTKPGAPPCSRNKADQDLGPLSGGNEPLGRNGIEVDQADGVSIENLTVCNFLKGAGDGGNEIWWNGGDGSGQIGMGPYLGRYLSTTSTFYRRKSPAASYGLFASNADGPGKIAHAYASNMDDSGYYVGACPDCNAVLNDVHAEYSALGYSGTNSGGHLVIRNSEWDRNKTGISTNSQNNDDAPSPQDGSCPGDDGYCTFFRGNDIHNNNNPNVPGAGTASLGPVGTGMVVAGGRFDTLKGNHIHDNGAWGVLAVPFPDNETPPPVSNCEGGTPGGFGFTCYYDDFGNRLLDNHFAGNGFFSNPTNGDIGDISGEHTPGNCYRGNSDPAGLTSDPANIEQTHGDCSASNSGNNLGSELAAQVICDTEIFAPCPADPDHVYPRTRKVVMPRLQHQPTMPRPYHGLPAGR
jgi:hypothetical protein